MLFHFDFMSLLCLQLNLGGNPLEILSSKLFLSTEHLSELDLSDCDLTKLWHDSSAKLRADNLLANLKFLNVSNNDIQNIFSSDLAVSFIFTPYTAVLLILN